MKLATHCLTYASHQLVVRDDHKTAMVSCTLRRVWSSEPLPWDWTDEAFLDMLHKSEELAHEQIATDCPRNAWSMLALSCDTRSQILLYTSKPEMVIGEAIAWVPASPSAAL